MNNSKPRHDDWDPCHPGLLHEAAQDVVSSRRRLIQILIAGISLGVLGSIAMFGVMLSEKEPEKISLTPAGISCIAVHEHLPTFVADKIPSEELTKRIVSHLLKCGVCRKKYDKMRCGCGTRPVNATIKPGPVNPPTP